MSYDTCDIVDTLYRSRITLLDHLETFGYNTTPYRKFSHKEIELMINAGPIAGSPPALNIELQKRDDVEDSIRKCIIITTIGKIKQKISAFTSTYIDAENGFDSATTELIIITLEPIAPTFHQAAFDAWNKHKTRVRYFQAAAIINNPLKHVLVPKHEKVLKDEEPAILQEMYAKKTQFPLIRFHEDPIARMLGILPGELVRITRPSPTSGVYSFYRICAL